MSKIGRKPIALGDTRAEIKGQEIHYSGKGGSGVYHVPTSIKAEVIENGKYIKLMAIDKNHNAEWGLHRALLANRIVGSSKGFEKELTITGLGFKGALAGSKINFSLGYSHKIDFEIPKGIAIEIDKTGQILKVKGSDKELVGHVCSRIKALRKTEPYKGTGIKLTDEVIFRKAGKTKSA